MSERRQTRVQRRRSLTIRLQVLLALMGMSLLAVAVFSAVFLVSRRHRVLRDLDRRLHAVAVLSREILPPDYHDRITGPESVSDAEFQAIVERNNRLCVELGLEYIWSLLETDGTIVFTSATSPDKVAANRAHASFFEAHSNPELYTNTFATMRATYGVNADKWGAIRVALVPATDRHGRKFLFGASVRLDEIARQYHLLMAQSALIGLALFAVSFLVARGVAHWVASPINELAATIQRISAGQGGLEVAEAGSRELVTLARHFNQMNRALQGRLEDQARSRERLIGRHDAEIKEAEAHVQMTEQRYRSLLNFAVDGILVGAHDGFIIEANQRMCELFGLTRDEMLGRHIREMPFTPESMRSTPLRFDLIQKGETVVSVRTIRRKDGAESVVEMHTKMMPDGTYQSIYLDITERIRTEQALAETRRLLDEAQQLAKMGAWKYEVASGRIVWTEEIFRIHGVPLDYDVSDLDRAIGFYAPEAQPVLRKAFRAALERGTPFDLELAFIRADGQRLWVRSSGRAVSDDAGHVVSLNGSFMDITERRQAEQALRESEWRYRQLFELESDAIVLFEVESGRLLDVNRAAQELYGYSREELLALRNSDLTDELPRTRALIEQGKAGNNEVMRVPFIRHRKKDGTVFPVEITGRFMDVNGGPVLVAAVRDITERQRAQELLEVWNATLERRVAERTDEVQDFARQLQALTARLVEAEEAERRRISDILHEDLQQTLVASRMTLDASLQRLRAGPARELVNRAEEMLERSIRLTRSLVQDLAVPAVQEGELPLAFGWLAQQMLEKFGLAVELTAEPDLPRVESNIYLCAYRVAQELLFNVVRHAQTLRARLDVRRAPADRIEISVSDDGCGFDPARATAGQPGGAVGIGLFSIRQRIEALGGEMLVESEAGAGTRIVILLPVQLPA